MSSPEPDSQLADWLPRLEVYRKAIDTVPVDTVPNGVELASGKVAEVVKSFEHVNEILDGFPYEMGALPPNAKPDDTVPIVETALPEPEIQIEKRDSIPLTIATTTTLKRSQIVHLPIDAILKQIKKAKSFVLGIGSVGESHPMSVRSVVTDLVARCCMKTDRNGMLVTVRSSRDILLHDSFQNALVRETRWSYLGDTKADMQAWHAQLAELPGWKQEFGLIVFDLGDMRFPKMQRIGRLCDGIVVQMLNPSDSRETIQALKSLQKDRLKILGAWSVELNRRNQAA